ncbi:MAG TPA: hypothetical protein VET85_03265 [Stellaceae bacterium]|nr:hypothetical protein [Stellaceae bacterium]
MRIGGRHWVSAALAVAAVLSCGPAFAGGQTTQLSVNSEALVRGAAPLPDFRLDFLLDDPARLPPQARGDNLEIALTAPDSGGFQFFFSPRPQLGFGVDRLTSGGRSYAGLGWNLYDSGSLFTNLALAGSYDPSNPLDPSHRLLGPPLLLRGGLEFGYHINDSNSLSLSLDQGRTPDLRLGGEYSDNLRLRYGLKF